MQLTIYDFFRCGTKIEGGTSFSSAQEIKSSPRSETTLGPLNLLSLG